MRDGYATYCHECEREKVRQWRRTHWESCYAQTKAWAKQNPERSRAIKKRWKERNPEAVADATRRRQARLRGVSVIEKVDREYVYKRDGGKCHICGRKVPRSDFTLDHLIPIDWSDVSEHTHRNLRVAHPSCNSSMGVARLPAQLLLVG